MNHIMLDLETMGTRPDAAIVAIGACVFDPYDTGRGADTFYERVSLRSSLAAGLSLDASTVEWWIAQAPAAKAETFTSDECYPLQDTILRFASWMRSAGDPRDTAVWGNGATFDNVVLRSAYRAVGLEPGWSFRNDKCYRTVVGLCPTNIPFERVGIYHCAVDDAVSQALHLQKVYAAMGLAHGR